MIKFIKLENESQVVDKLNKFKDSGWNLNVVYNQIVPTIDGKFIVFYDEKLELK